MDDIPPGLFDASGRAGATVVLTATLGRNTNLDGVAISDLFHLGSLARTFDPANIKNIVLPTSDRSGSNLVMSAAAPAPLADFGDDAVLQATP